MLVACDSGDKTAPNFVIGSVWAPIEGALFEFEEGALHLRVKNRCWGKFEWKKSKSSQDIIKTYFEFVDLFLKKNIFFSSIIINQNILKKFGKHLGKNIEESLPEFIYLLISRASKRYCKEKTALHILLDNEGFETRKKISFIKDSITNYFLKDLKPKEKTRVEHLQECDSHICSLLQICDLLVGAVSTKINNRSTSESNLKIIRNIEKELSINLGAGTPVWSKKINIWLWQPTSMLKP